LQCGLLRSNFSFAMSLDPRHALIPERQTRAAQ
jgi:hypothetical protein